MSFQLPQLPENFSGATYYGIVGIAVAIVVISRLSRGPNLHAFPTVGPSSSLDSWWAGFKSPTNAADILQEGYEKHKSAPFKVADRHHWMVILSNPKHLEELLRAPEDELSLAEAANDRISIVYTLGHEVHESPFHVAVIRSQLTRNIGAMYPDIRAEVVTAFDEVLDLKGDEWKSVPALSTMQKVTCRTANRVFVGLQLCHDPDWIDLNLQYTLVLNIEGQVLGLFPKFLRPLAACFFTRGVAQCTKRGLKHLGPMIEERQKYLNEYGNGWAEKPNDLLSWLMDEAEGSQWTVKSLVTGILVVNFVAIHSTSNSFTHVLFYLAANPQYIQPLREEVESIVEKEGWSKAALGKMRKVDSFLRECQRLEGTNALAHERKALKDFTFSDGTFIPKGTTIGVPSRSVHHDGKFYQNAEVFEPFRFADMREEGGEGAKHQLVSTATEYLPFGYGKHACPGRFFAASGLRSMLAHIVMTYDVKLEDNTPRPCSLHFGAAIVPDHRAKVMFRKRVD